MVDSPTANNRLRKQGLGTNTNTWGDTKLNEALDVIDQAMDGYIAIALTTSADYTLTTTNYTTADEAKNRVLKFTGTLSAVVNVIVPSVEHEYSVINACGQTLTVKTSAGTGVAIPTGYQARVYCDSVNVYNGSPTFGGHPTPATGSLAIPAWSAVEAAIAAAGVPATAGTILISGTDTTAGYPGTKITASGAVALSVTSPGGNEKLNIAVGALGLTSGAAQTTSFVAAVNTRYSLAKTGNLTITMPAAPAVGDVVWVEISGTAGLVTWGLNGLKNYGSTTNPVSSAEGIQAWSYSGASRGWIDL